MDGGVASTSTAESPRMIALEDNDSNSCVMEENNPTAPPVKKKKEKRQEVILWGEMETVVEEENPLTHAIIKDMKKKAILAAVEPVVTDEQESVYLLFPPSLTIIDERVLHSIKLQNYARNVESMIEDIKAGGTEDDKVYPPVPEMPKASVPIQDRRSFFPDIRMEKDPTDFAVGRGKPALHLPPKCARIILRRSISALLSHHSFTDASNVSLNNFVDVTDRLLHNVCERLRIASDQEAMSGHCGFNSTTERAIAEMNLGSLDNVLEYYQTVIIGIHNRMEKKCSLLSETYSNLVKAKVDGLTEQAEQVEVNIPVEEEEYEEEEDEEDIPEIHFPALDEDDQLGFQPSLETGFQMLDSLEHDESLQNLDPDEEINVDSPSQEFMLSVITELSNTLEMSKTKKRKKKS